MKKIIITGLLLIFTMAVSGFAQPGGIFSDILNNAEQVTLEGKVLSVPTPYSGQIGQGMSLDTSNGDITIYGLGPIWYWNKNNVTRPIVGDTVTATVYKLDINGKLYYVLKSITLADGKTLNFRDDSTNLPLWIGQHGYGGHKGGMFGKGMGKHQMFKNYNCPCTPQ